MSEQPKVIYLKDYTVPTYLIDKTTLHFDLYEDKSVVSSQLEFRLNPESKEQQPALVLFGDASVKLIRLELNGEPVTEDCYQLTEDKLSITALPEQFTLKIITEIEPQNNTALEGLYKSDGMFCTQCEAEGFRRITFYPDRPDVMTVFETTIEADKALYPVLLSNGNCVAQGDKESGRHWVTWADPFPKPSYLFALVAGDLQHIHDQFVTMSGRTVDLYIYAEEKDLDKLDYAMLSLKNAMKWDEEVYGREYDLDIYMIVAVDFFNMGAMENKGLNIFNTSCVLANPKTTTDVGFQRVEGVVAHEYFHNWSGNRVTCRDWFQLSLKEGFTVFRDAEFSADMNSATVKRVEDVTLLRTSQFAEDAGPMAHPIRPDSFIEISNFYTLTVYEKGAEVVRMIHTLLGPELFRKGSDLYFERHDGQAVTTEDFVSAMEQASGRDLSQFRSWYHQAGTPHLDVTGEYDAQGQRFLLNVKQSCPATPGQDKKTPFHIPLTVGLIDQTGASITLENGEVTQVLDVTEADQQFVFQNVGSKPVPSLLRGFSAPVKLDYPYSREELMFLMAHDCDGFSRWDAAQKLSVDIMQALIEDHQGGDTLKLDPLLVDAFRSVLQQEGLDRAMVSKVLTLPSEAYLAELAARVDVDAIHQVREFVRKQLASELESDFVRTYQENNISVAYQPDAASIARRSLKNLALSYLLLLDQDQYMQMACDQYHQADNMTDQQSALALLVHANYPQQSKQLLDDFYQQWQNESLVVNLWLSVQASDPKGGALSRVKALMKHPAYDGKNPNKLRAVIGGFCMQNSINFHHTDGSGYQFLADQVIELNQINPQIAARILTPLTRWRKYDGQRQQLMRTELERILACDELSKDVYEVVSKSLN